MSHETKHKSDLTSNAMTSEKTVPELPFQFALPQLPFKAIIFDWDGTVVVDRHSGAWPLVRELEGILRQGVICVVITGTHFKNVNDPAIRFISPTAKRNLYVCTYHGSEVYSFNEIGSEVLLFRRDSTREEEVQLDHAIESLKNYFKNMGLETEIIGNRLNRRKLDLIPMDPWKAPSKAQLLELLQAVQQRVKKVGIIGGLSNLMDVAEVLAKKAGLETPKVTSDIKHIEIGLTDKSASVQWIFNHLLREKEIASNQVVILGDEFGPIGGLPGSDSLMRVADSKGANFVSVGIEPEGVPEGIKHIGGGPQSFIEFLKFQKLLTVQNSTMPFPESTSWGWKERDSTWLIEQEGFDPSRESELEPLFTVGNGYLGIRGSVSIPIPSSRGDLHFAGVYDRKIGVLPYSELDFLTVDRKSHAFAEIVTFPSVFQFRLRVTGQEYCPGRWQEEKYQRDLSLGSGILFERFDLPLRGFDQSIIIRTSRFASLHNPHLLIQEIELWTEGERIELDLDLSFEDPEHELKHPHLKVISMETGNPRFTELHEFNTQVSQMNSVFLTRAWCGVRELNHPRIQIALESRNPVVITRFICAYTARDGSNPKELALSFMRTLQYEKQSLYLYEHVEKWRKFWSNADVQFKNNSELTEAQRFNIYQMRIAAGEDPRISIGARGLTGSAYEGHSFWDTEIFLLPFLLHTSPMLAKNCLEYRFNTLEAARKRAREMGYQGACFAWESTVDGDDVTPTQIILKGSNRQVPIYTGKQQIHVTADIAFAVWNYWNGTQDKVWLLNHGLELLIETARFWASRVVLQDGYYHILKVIGPDEYHHDVDDNAYTNWMAKFNLEKAYQLCIDCKNYENNIWNNIVSKLGLQSRELDQWVEIARKLYFPKPNQNGIIEQFRGFFDLKETKIARHEQLRAPLNQLLAWERVNQEQVIKQSDVLMIPFLFPNAFSKEVIAANYHYYEPKTDHGSSLSPAVYAAIAAQIGEWKDCERYWSMAIHLDLDNSMKNTSLGIHVGCMGGSWQSLMFHILGVTFAENGIVTLANRTASIPLPWQGITARLIFRGKYYQLQVGKDGRIELCPIERENL